MNGTERDPGIIHRAVKDIFDRIRMVFDYLPPRFVFEVDALRIE